MSISENNLKALVDFAQAASDFCELIDGLRDRSPERLYRRLEAILVRLHTLIMPIEMEIAEDKHPEFDEMDLSNDQWNEIAERIGQVVGKEITALFEWHEVLRSKDEGGVDYCATRAGMLWDDLADIYRDLINGLALWRLETEDARAEAAWKWRWGYENHWGAHLFRAMTTVHEVQYQLCED